MRRELSSELVRKEEPSGDHLTPLRKLPAEEEQGERNWSAKWYRRRGGGSEGGDQTGWPGRAWGFSRVLERLAPSWAWPGQSSSNPHGKRHVRRIAGAGGDGRGEGPARRAGRRRVGGLGPLRVLRDLPRRASSLRPPFRAFALFFCLFVGETAVEVAKSAIADIQQPPEQEAEPEEGGKKENGPEGEEGDERRKAALDKLENASEDSLLGQASTSLAAPSLFSAMPGLKVFDTSVESITTGTWQALGSAWRSGSLIVQKYYAIELQVVILNWNGSMFYAGSAQAEKQ
uniref:Uncharacterized protein n=1 Tax=Aegilops tauschii TaxID=37682 RepID=M8D1P9_AEGTA